MSTPKASPERLVLEEILQHLPSIPVESLFRGQGSSNRFGIGDWGLPANQQSQFGDLRIEWPTCTIIVETESAGGVTNLVKYWPLLAERSLQRRFVLVHIFGIGSKGDYMAHRRLWEYLIQRMRSDLQSRCGVRWPEDWYARLFTYHAGESLSDISTFIRSAHDGDA